MPQNPRPELPTQISVAPDATCGACLLELNEDGGNHQEASVASRCSERLRLRTKYIAALEGCQHLFHVRCVLVWAEVENSCPQCRSRFRRFGEYNVVTGQLRKISEVQQRDQTGDSSSEEITCDFCGRGDNDELLLLCDGRRGRCPGACHTYCDGLGRQVPRGRWLCFACRPAANPSRPMAKASAKSRGRRGQAQALLNATMANLVAEPSGSSGQPGESQKMPAAVQVKVEKTQENRPQPMPKREAGGPRVKREHAEIQPSGASAANTDSRPTEPSEPAGASASTPKVVKETPAPKVKEEASAQPYSPSKVAIQAEAMRQRSVWKLQAAQMSIDLEEDQTSQADPDPSQPDESEAAEADQPQARRRYHILSLPSELEDWAEQVRKFASTYFLCERSMPLANRTAERLWKLCQIGPCPVGGDSDEECCRQLLAIARDSFQLFWQLPLDPGDDDPCGLRCLRTKAQPLLCVRYTGPRGKRGRIRPSDIVRCELQCRRRLLELWDAGRFDGGFGSLPMVELPPQESKTKTQGDIPRARAAVAVDHIAQSTSGLSGMDLVNSLKEESWYFNQAVHVSQTTARTARFAEPRAVLHPLLKEVLLESLRSRSSAVANSDQLKLYSHQAEAIDEVLLNKKDVVVSTSTGSGKSLVYLTAIFEALLQREDATAILIFPTKALAQDQLRTLKDLAQALVSRGVPEQQLSIACLDGDTPGVERARVRKEARVVLTNPDMLHSHVLPQHIEYSRLLHNVCYVVLDEVHVYRGAFGANVCSVLRRLRRLVEVEERTQDALQFIACSATVANPGEHLERLLGRPSAHVVARDGSPSGGHIYVLWNPMEVGPRERKPDDDDDGSAQQAPAKRIKTEAPPGADTSEAPEDPSAVLGSGGARSSPIVEVTRLLAWLVSRDVSVLAFCKWRSLVEIVLQDVKDALTASEVSALSNRVVSYRAGYPPALRRQLERDIFHRKVLGVACTNALELGIDIGRLDCTISLGFPGSVASLRQQFGRAGRAGRLGLSFYVAFDDPTDQHFMRRPRELLARRPESVAVAPCNVAVMRNHLPCAAAERPLEAADQRYWEGADDSRPGRDAWTSAVQKCLTSGTMERRMDRSADGVETSQLIPARFWGLKRGPHRAVSIRAVEDHFQVFEEVEPLMGEPRYEDGGFIAEPRRDMGPAEASLRKLDEIEISKAFYSLHPGAVYRYRGSEYNVTNLDVTRRRAVVKRCEAPLPYYTRAFDSTVVRIQTREKHAVSGEAKVFLGEMELESRVKTFKRFWKSQDVPQESEVELNLPSWGYTSRGLWFEDPLGVARQPTLGDPPAGDEGWSWGCGWAGAHAAMHALLKVFPLFVLADRPDLDAACVDEHGLPPMDRPRLMIFDAKDGGLGLCDAAFQHGFAILREARRLVEDCPCENGCPQCIIDSHCREYNRLLSKRGALEWLKGLESGAATDGRDMVT